MLTAVLLVACSQSFKLGLEAPSTIQLNPVAQLSRKRCETTLGWNRYVDDSKWNNAGAFGFLLGYIIDISLGELVTFKQIHTSIMCAFMHTETFRGEGHATKIYQAPVIGQTQSQLPIGTTKKTHVRCQIHQK